jgi:nitroreductase
MPGLLKVIRDRHSTRGSFDPSRPIAMPDVKKILEAARWAPTPNNMQNFEIIVVDGKEQIEAIGKIPAEMSEYFLRENYAQLSFSEDELRIKKVGMLASVFPKAWTNPEAWSPDSDYRSQLTFLGRSVVETPLLLVVLYDGGKRAPGSEGDLLGHMGLGCVMENMWLMGESLGIGFHVLTVFSDGPVEKQVKSVLHIPPDMKIGFACTLGYPTDPPANYPRVRRTIEDFVHHNQFGKKDVLWDAHQR